jgi:hypothetical protein
MIQICIPHTGDIDANLVNWLINEGHKPYLQKSYSVCKGRNLLMDQFITMSSADWLFYLDSDMHPATPNLFKFVEQQTDIDCMFVPGITNKLKWNMSLDTSELLGLNEYKPNGQYELKPTNIFGGSGIFLHRRLVEKLPKNIWRESNNDITSEDILFSYNLTQTYKVPAYVIYNSALHHYKGGFDLLSLVNL